MSEEESLCLFWHLITGCMVVEVVVGKKCVYTYGWEIEVSSDMSSVLILWIVFETPILFSTFFFCCQEMLYLNKWHISL